MDRAWSIVLVALTMVAAVAGCASLPPAKTVTNVNQIAGKWEGAVSSNFGTWSVHEGDGKRILVYKADDGRVTAELKPAK